MRAHFLERAGERLDVGVGKVLREVSLDAVAVIATCLFHRLRALRGQDYEDRAAIVCGVDSLDEPCRRHAVDDASKTALAVEDPFGELVHADASGRFLEVNEDVVPTLRDPDGLLELGVEHVP